MTIQTMMQEIENSLIEISNSRNNRVGTLPRFPMVIFFIGEDEGMAYNTLSKQLKQKWPQFSQDFQYISIHKKGNEEEYFLLNENKKSPISIKQLKVLVEENYDEQSEFESKMELGMPFIISTDELSSFSEYRYWIQKIEDLKETIRPREGINIKTPLFLLGDSNKSCFNEIKESLQGFPQKDTPVDTVLILSKVLSDGTILKERTLQFQAIAATLTLLNNKSNHFSLINKVITVAYQRQEKPIASISQILLKTFMEQMERTLWDNKAMEKEQLLHTCQEVIVEEVVHLLPHNLPDTAILSALPMRSMEPLPDILVQFAYHFNQQTMGTFEIFVKKMVSDQLKKIVFDSSTIKNQLLCKLSNQDFLLLSRFMTELSERIPEKLEQNEQIKVNDFIKNQFIYQVSLSKKESILNEIKAQISQIKEFKSNFDQLIDDKNTLHSVKDTELERFYGTKVKQFWEENEEKYQNEIKAIETITEFYAFFHKIVQDMIQSISCLRLPFEEELSQRWQQKQGKNIQEVYDDIYQKFSKNDVTFFMSGSAMTKLNTFIMLNHSNEMGSLSDYLNQKYDPSLFYDTANSSVAEIITFYQLEDYHLV